MDEHPHAHYQSPRIEARCCPEKGGSAVFAREHIARGELLVVWGGNIVNGAELAAIPPARRRYILQVEEDLYQVSPGDGETADLINHSCRPNAGMNGQIALVAMRGIDRGEEICFDYAMSDGSPYDEFDCRCGSRWCRGRVTGNDWKQPQLQRRYRRYFSPYLQRRIDQQRRETRVLVADLSESAVA